MDIYTKGILTVIAIALSTIALKLSVVPANAGILSQGPTFGDLLDLRSIKDSEELKAARINIYRAVPLVRVQGGQVDVSGSVEIDN